MSKKQEIAFVVVWEFSIRRSKRREFEQAYGPDGDWAKLFRGGKGYIRTELIRDWQKAGRYLTLDFWESRPSYEQFKKKNRASYRALDKKCVSLTEDEIEIGHFECLANVPLQPHIRPATVDDVRSIVSLEREVQSAAHWPELTYRRVFEEKGRQPIAFVCEAAGAVQGFVIGRAIGPDCELENVVVDHRNRSRGIGSTLVRALIRAARTQKVERIFLEVRESNQAAHSLYEKCGFRITGRRKAYYTAPAEDAVLYTWRL